MRRFRFHSFLDDGLLIVLIMIAAVAAAALEAGALFGAVPDPMPVAMAGMPPSSTVESALAHAPAASVQLAAHGPSVTKTSR